MNRLRIVHTYNAHGHLGGPHERQNEIGDQKINRIVQDPRYPRNVLSVCDSVSHFFFYR